MTRKLLIAAVMMIALTVGGLSLEAEAQDCSGYNTCITYPGFTRPAPTPTPVPTPVPPAPTAEAAAAAGTEANIAFTGSETTVVGSLGIGLVGLGAFALGARRRVMHDNNAD